MGVFLCRVRPPVRLTSLPHARGGVSEELEIDLIQDESSPRTWGCFLESSSDALFVGVFPTHVGVFLRSPTLFEIRVGLPHARGGVS